MKRHPVLMTILIVFACLLATSIAFGVTVARHVHVMSVDIVDRDSGVHVGLGVPVIFARGVLTLPVHHARGCNEEELNAALKVLSKMGDAPDFTLLEVEDGDDHVTIRKEGRTLRLRVDSRDALVNVSIPQSTFDSI